MNVFRCYVTYNFFYRACRTGNVELVKLLLKHGAIAKPHRQTSYSPLYIACRIGNLEIVQLLLTVRWQESLLY